MVVKKAYLLGAARYLRTRIIPTGLTATITLPVYLMDHPADLLDDLMYLQKAVKGTTIILIIITPEL